MERNNDKALDAFMKTMDEINNELTALGDQVSNHFGYSPEEINWGHVGSAQHVLELLQEIEEFLN